MRGGSDIAVWKKMTMIEDGFETGSLEVSTMNVHELPHPPSMLSETSPFYFRRDSLESKPH